MRAVFCYSTSMSKVDLIKQLAEQIVADDVCPVLREGATQLVMGEGSLDAKIVFVGEAPGKKEDELGRPFVGASGKFLDEMLASIGLKREDVYITNIVKYRPPGNRDPLPEEKAEFAPYLLRQIQIIKPEVIVTLGRHALSFFKADLAISRVHGRPFKLKTATYDLHLLPLYHPAAALYNGSMRQQLLDDFQVVKRFLYK